MNTPSSSKEERRGEVKERSESEEKRSNRNTHAQQALGLSGLYGGRLSYPELYLNPQGIPKSFPSHFHMIPESFLSTLKYSQVSRVKPEPVHLPPYT